MQRQEADLMERSIKGINGRIITASLGVLIPVIFMCGVIYNQIDTIKMTVEKISIKIDTIDSRVNRNTITIHDIKHDMAQPSYFIQKKEGSKIIMQPVEQ